MEEEKENENISRRVNDLLTIHYVNNLNQSIFSHNPTYTHQLFDNEMILLDEESKHLQVELRISIHDLQSSLHIDNASDGVRSIILEKITPLLTPESMNCSFFDQLQPIDSFNECNDKFEYYLLTYHDQSANELLKRAEKVAMWYIETASSIDFEDDKWEVLYLIQRDSYNRITFSGYYTLYTFHNPFLGSKLRICQALILPPFHGRGYGKKMLHQVYRTVQSRKHVTEITVEDPAESFQNLRDIADLEWYLSNPQLAPPELKLIPLQIDFVHNALEFHEIQKLVEEKNQEELINRESKKRPFEDSNSEEKAIHDAPQLESKDDQYRQKIKEFRLKNKRSLLQRNGDLKGLDKATMQKELSDLYEELEKRYRRVRKHILRAINE